MQIPPVAATGTLIRINKVLLTITAQHLSVINVPAQPQWVRGVLMWEVSSLAIADTARAVLLRGQCPVPSGPRITMLP